MLLDAKKYGRRAFTIGVVLVVGISIGATFVATDAWAVVRDFRVLLKSGIKNPSTSDPLCSGCNATAFSQFKQDIVSGSARQRTWGGVWPVWVESPAFNDLVTLSNWQNMQPDPDNNAATKPTNYRLFGSFVMNTSCSGSGSNWSLAPVNIYFSTTNGGYEASTWPFGGGSKVGPIYDVKGVMDNPITTAVYAGPSGSTVSQKVQWVLAGQPNDDAEAAGFTPVKARTNKKIYQAGEITITCSSTGEPQLSITKSLGSSYPTHNISIFRDDTHAYTGISKSLPQGATGIGLLWSLGTKPTLPLP